MQIAGTKTDSDWKSFRTKLINKPNAALWKMAFDDYYFARLQTRYLQPIEKLQAKSSDSKQGEGFSIVAILCTLVEFLESCERGYNFRLLEKKGDILAEHEYSQREAASYFRDFLMKREPFKNYFDATSAHSFYRDVRCGLLHEARTKGGWLIRWGGSKRGVIDLGSSTPILYRNKFRDGFETYFADYRQRLETTENLQQAFIRKFDHLCM